MFSKFKELSLRLCAAQTRKGFSIEIAPSSTYQAPSPWLQADSRGRGVSGGEREEEGPVKMREGTIAVSQDPSSTEKDKERREGFLSSGSILWGSVGKTFKKIVTCRETEGLSQKVLTFVTTVGRPLTQGFVHSTCSLHSQII